MKGFTNKKVIINALRLAALSSVCASCERNPELHLDYDGNINVDLPIVELQLDVYWDYYTDAEGQYDWRNEWYYGWDEEDQQLFGEIGYTKPVSFQIRRYYTGAEALAAHQTVNADLISGYTYSSSFDWGFWDLLAWNEVQTLDGVQSLRFDEQTSLDYVIAYTGQTMNSAHYQAPLYTRSFYQPEALFSAYSQAVEINKDLDGFVYDEDRNVWVKELQMLLQPITYIYLTQVIVHHNNGKITGVDGNSNFSGMARSVNVNTGVAGADPVTVHYYVRFKKGCDMKGESVDIAGGRLLTFGMCNVNGNTMTRADDNDVRHYMDVDVQFNNGMDSTLVFDVTDQVRRRYKGGVITVELDADTIKIPTRTGGSGFDAVVKDFEDGGTHEFEM